MPQFATQGCAVPVKRINHVSGPKEPSEISFPHETTNKGIRLIGSAAFCGKKKRKFHVITLSGVYCKLPADSTQHYRIWESSIDLKVSKNLTANIY